MDITPIRSKLVEGYPESGVNATVTYTNNHGNKKEMEIEVENVRKHGRSGNLREVVGTEVEGSRQIILRQGDRDKFRMYPVVISKKLREYKLGELENIEFERDAKKYTAYLHASSTILLPEDPTEREIQENGKRSNPNVHHVSSLVDKETSREVYSQ